MSAGYEFLKGHGTENDFVLLPDHDGTVHGALDPARVRALCTVPWWSGSSTKSFSVPWPLRNS